MKKKYTLSICNQYCKKPKYRKNAEKNKPITFAAKMVGGGGQTLAAKCIYTG